MAPIPHPPGPELRPAALASPVPEAAPHVLQPIESYEDGVIIRVRGDEVWVRPIRHSTWVDNGDTIAVLPQSKLSAELRSIRAPRVREVLDMESPIAGDHPSR